MYFRLKPNCLKFDGANKCILYNASDGKAYWMSRNETIIMRKLEINTRLDEIYRAHKNKKKINLLLKHLKDYKLGDFYASKTCIDKININSMNELEPHNPIKINKISIEITNKCSLDCVFCDDNNYKYCGCQKNGNRYISLGRLKNVLYEAKIFDIKKIQIIGGDPFIVGDRLRKLIIFIRENNIPSIDIHSNGILITQSWISFLSKYRVSLTIPVYSNDENQHDYISKTKGSYIKIIRNIVELNRNNIKLNAILYLSNQNVNDIKKIYDYYRFLGCNIIKIKYIYPQTNNKTIRRHFMSLYNKNMPIRKIDKYPLLNKKNYNPCLQGCVGITSSGDVVPCNLAREHVIGNIFRESFREIIKNGKIDVYWRSDKNMIYPCNICEFRYLCSDCFILEHSFKNGVFGKNHFCGYNPDLGEWKVIRR